ncbi:MAG: hypothetical protein WCO56_29725, partial [Verrucomicrobiota bacterium]
DGTDEKQPSRDCGLRIADCGMVRRLTATATCWGLLLGLHLGVTQTAAAACGLEVRLDVITVATNYTKVGFPALVRDPQNPTIYFGKEITNYNSQSYDAEGYTISCLNCHDSYSAGTRAVYAFSLTNLTTPTCTDFFGVINKSVTYRDTNGFPVNESCNFSTTSLGTWTANPGCVANYECRYDNSIYNTLVSNLTAQQYELSQSYAANDLMYSSDNSPIGEFSNACQVYQKINLDSAYSLSDFVATAQGCLSSIPWPGWSNATDYGVAEYGSITNVIYPPSAYDSLETAGFQAAYGKLKFRIAFRGPKDEKARIEWRYVFIPMDGGPPVTNSVQYEDVTFTGDLQYIQKTGGEDGLELGPPPSPGQLMVKLDTTWQCSSEICQLGQTTANLDSVNVKFGLGNRFGGSPAGYLYLNAATLDSGLGTPQGLASFLNNDGQVIRGSGNVLRQVRVPEGLADIVAVTGQKYEIRFYSQAGSWNTASNCYVPTGNPLKTSTIEYVAGSPSVLRISDAQSGLAYEYTSEVNNGQTDWSLTTRQGATVLRQESLTISADETAQARAIGTPDAIVYEEVSEWATYAAPLGKVRVRQIINPNDPNPQTNSWSYYTNPGDTNRYGLLAQTSQANGYWERYYYDDARRLTNKTSQFKTAAPDAAFNQCRAITYSYASVDATVDNGSQEPLTPRST